MSALTKAERAQIAAILTRRANEVSGFSSEYTSDPKHHGSVELALSREVHRLRALACKVCPPDVESEP